MSDQEVIYSTVRVRQSPSESQNPGLSPDGAQRPGKADDRGCMVSWRLTAVTLGVLCSLLLATVVVLGTRVFQYIQEKHQWQEVQRNLSQKLDIMENDSYLKEQHLTNKTLEYDILKNESLQQKDKLNFIETELCLSKRDHPSESLQNTGKLRDGHWSCYGVSCYYFTLESKGWSHCKQTCQSYGTSFLKIDDGDELAFIRSRIHPDNYWIGLSNNGQERNEFAMMNSNSGIGKCAFLSSTRVETDDCSRTYRCICEKMMISLLQEISTRKR
ncbi:Killer cell lectin-like receptor 5 [Galemys pyrenaicus]|uniref:Killer cell lectin-like receptor 5 n=1 Tax=Galemys pyrenaicus TaxID=202257 RepID=A0A8J6DLE0_GALPY|nr:Killer cell lectin-like receptor 5 [Galemys pyrenaicus]